MASGLLIALAAAAAVSAPPPVPVPVPQPAAAPSSAPAVAPRPSVITNPDWVARPDAQEFSSLYPPGATFALQGGRVVIRCTVTAAGTLRDCVVADEAPAGWGFGDAALAISAFFKMKPATRDGTPVDGLQVQIPLHFALSDQGEPKAGLAEAGSCYGVLSLYAEQTSADRGAMAEAVVYSSLVGYDLAAAGQGAPSDFERRLTAERTAAAHLPAAEQARVRGNCAAKLKAALEAMTE